MYDYKVFSVVYIPVFRANTDIYSTEAYLRTFQTSTIGLFLQKYLMAFSHSLFLQKAFIVDI